MNTRMSKYHNTENLETRVERNKNIYAKEEIQNLENLNLENNVSIIEADVSNLNINQLKEILEKKYSYNENKYNNYDVENENEDIEDTKEYDLKKIIEAARNETTKDYNDLRFKKIKESEYEILNSLNLKKEKHSDEILANTDDEKTLVELIKTVNDNAQKRIEETNVNLMSELMGGNNTEVLKPIVSEDVDTTTKKPTIIEELEKTKQLSKGEILDSFENNNEDFETDDDIEEESKNIPLMNTFYTGNLSIKDSDLDDFKDLQKELKSNNVLIKLLVTLLVLIVIAVIVYLYLNDII